MELAGFVIGVIVQQLVFWFLWFALPEVRGWPLLVISCFMGIVLGLPVALYLLHQN